MDMRKTKELNSWMKKSALSPETLLEIAKETVTRNSIISASRFRGMMIIVILNFI